MLMPLPFREWLTMLVPPSYFYRRRISKEARSGEPELAVLAKLAPRGGIAVDIGANQGVYAYALADIADRVVAFEPNPDYAFFARWMLRGRAEVHQLALSDKSGRGTLHVPLSDRGMVLHLAGSLKQTHSQFRNSKIYDVEIRTLDDFGLMNVRFVKADVEGSEREVLDGARAIRNRADPPQANRIRKL
jgi:FkbM family methyltransferase